MFSSVKKTIVLFSFFYLSALPLQAADLPLFTIMTEDWKPYQYEQDGQLKGFAVDLLVELLKETGSPQGRENIRIVPWARGYKTLIDRNNTILFSMTRTPERENLFKWVGPIFQNTIYLIGKKTKHIKISNPEMLKNYRIGTIIDDAGEQDMVKLGIPLDQLERNSSNVSNLKKLYLDRIDLIVCGWTTLINNAEQAGINPENYETVYTVDSADLYFAFNINTPDRIIDLFQKTLDRMKASGRYDQLYRVYSNWIPE